MSLRTAMRTGDARSRRAHRCADPCLRRLLGWGVCDSEGEVGAADIVDVERNVCASHLPRETVGSRRVACTAGILPAPSRTSIFGGRKQEKTTRAAGTNLEREQ